MTEDVTCKPGFLLPVLEHVGKLIFRAKVVNFLIRLGVKNGVMPSHNEYFYNDV